jgi:excisionase family DNA binding protein
MADTPLTEQFLTVAEVAEMLKLNQQTIRNWIDAGTLPAVRIGRRVRVKQSDLQRLLDAGYQAGTGSPGGLPGPSARDFWAGEPVGAAELDDHLRAGTALDDHPRVGTALDDHPRSDPAPDDHPPYNMEPNDHPRAGATAAAVGQPAVTGTRTGTG